MRGGDVSILASPVLEGYRKGGLYYLAREVPSACRSSEGVASKLISVSLSQWHSRLGHIGLKPLKAFLKENLLVPSVSDDEAVQRCEVCIGAKMHRLPFLSRSVHRSHAPGSLIHSDVGSFEIFSREGYKYFSTFIDDASKFVSIFLMKSKSQTLSCFKLFKNSFESQAAVKILSLRSDNGGEYLSKEFETYLSQFGISHEPGPPHSPELNRVAERYNRVVGERVRCALLSAGMAKSFWEDALRHIAHLNNSIPCHTPLGYKSPYAILQMPLPHPSLYKCQPLSTQESTTGLQKIDKLITTIVTYKNT